MDETGRNERKWYVAQQTTHPVKHDKKNKSNHTSYNDCYFT